MFQDFTADQLMLNRNRYSINRCRRDIPGKWIRRHKRVRLFLGWDVWKQQGLAVKTIKLKLPLVDNSRVLRIAGNPSKLSILHCKINLTANDTKLLPRTHGEQMEEYIIL